MGSVVVKKLEDAEADNDNILGVILSGSTNHSANAISITHPHAGAQKDNYRSVLDRAAINPLDVSYIELHGTGTQAGDAVESESVSDVFAPVSHRRRPDQRLLLSAVKSNIGHGEAAAGIASLIKTLLVFRKSVVPMHIGIKTVINPTIPSDLARRNVELPLSNTPWPQPPGGKRLALVNSFGAHGGNTTLLLEDGPQKHGSSTTHPVIVRSFHPVVLTARSKKSLQGNVQTMLDYIERNPSTNLADLSYTTCARRMHHPFRIATTVSDITGLQKYLSSTKEECLLSNFRPIPSHKPKVVFMFAGQGTVYSGMGLGLLSEFPVFRDQILQLDRLVQRLGFSSIVPLIEGKADAETAPSTLLQLAIVVLELALCRLWMTLGVEPSAVIGHSLGEYTALAVAGVLSVADVLNLVGRRGELIEKGCQSGSHCMLSVRATPSEIEQILGPPGGTGRRKYELCCLNTFQDTVIGGEKEIIDDEIRKELETSCYKCVRVDVPYAFHTSQMDPILDDVEKMSQQVPFNAPTIPVLSPLEGGVIFDGKAFDARYLRHAGRNPVDFAGTIKVAMDTGITDQKTTMWLDIGPHPVCSSFLRNLIPGARTVSSCRRNEDNIATLSKSMIAFHQAGLKLSWTEYFQPNEKAYSLLVLPDYSWNNTNYWIPYLGTWTLDKAHLKYGGEKNKKESESVQFVPSSLRTSLVHHVTLEEIDGDNVRLHTLSDMQHPEFLAALHGHKMNKYGVATSVGSHLMCF